MKLIILALLLILVGCSEPTRNADGLLSDSQNLVIKNYIEVMIIILEKIKILFK